MKTQVYSRFQLALSNPTVTLIAIQTNTCTGGRVRLFSKNVGVFQVLYFFKCYKLTSDFIKPKTTNDAIVIKRDVIDIPQPTNVIMLNQSSSVLVN